MDKWTTFEKVTGVIIAMAGAAAALFAAIKGWPWARQQQPEALAAPVTPPSIRPRILIVDDEPNMAELIRQCLANDCEAHTATSPYRALSEIFERYERHECFDLLILDQMFEGTFLTGSDVAKIITIAEEKQQRCRTKIALLSGVGAILPKQYGINAVWSKPRDLSRLSERVKELLAE